MFFFIYSMLMQLLHYSCNRRSIHTAHVVLLTILALIKIQPSLVFCTRYNIRREKKNRKKNTKHFVIFPARSFSFLFGQKMPLASLGNIVEIDLSFFSEKKKTLHIITYQLFQYKILQYCS